MNTKKVPFLVYIVFHPQSKKAREYARAIHMMLNNDPVVPGLKIPTRFVPDDESGLPPMDDTLNRADKVFAVVLADEYINAGYDSDIPEHRRDWGPWVADLYEACAQDENRRCVPFQLSSSAWPLDPRLSGVNFPRAWSVKEDERTSWIEQRLIIELVRFMNNEDMKDEEHPRAPLTIFVSHTKMDIDKEPKVVEELLHYMSQDKPVDAWFDSGDIEAGFKFEDKITEGVNNSALLCVLTDCYGSREWCQKEILLAKEKKRPILVIDALNHQEIRSFPYIGNVPVLRWNRSAKTAITLLFKETLRQFHTELILEQSKKKDDIILTSAPELVVLLGQKEKTFLYPDPPVGQTEAALIEKTRAKIETPLQRFAKTKKLKKITLALSLSESGDQNRYGFDLMHIDSATIDISRYLLLAGATLAYGGHLGSTGYTLHLFNMVQAYPQLGLKSKVKRIVSYIGWPLPLSVKQKSTYKTMADFKRIPRPKGLSEEDDPAFVENIEAFLPANSPIRRFAWAQGMTAMRKAQTSAVDARIVMGGKYGPTITATADGERKEEWYRSRIPGVMEEILLSLEEQQPVFLIGGFGGCARLAADIIRGIKRDEFSWDYQKKAPHAPEMRQLYEDRNIPWESYEKMTIFLQNTGINGLNNGLSDAENEELFDTFHIDRIVELVLKGLQS